MFVRIVPSANQQKRHKAPCPFVICRPLRRTDCRDIGELPAKNSERPAGSVLAFRDTIAVKSEAIKSLAKRLKVHRFESNMRLSVGRVAWIDGNRVHRTRDWSKFALNLAIECDRDEILRALCQPQKYVRPVEYENTIAIRS